VYYIIQIPPRTNTDGIHFRRQLQKKADIQSQIPFSLSTSLLTPVMQVLELAICVADLVIDVVIQLISHFSSPFLLELAASCTKVLIAYM